MITKGKCNVHLQDFVKGALRERQDSASRPTAYMCSNLLYENAEHNSDNFRALIEVARQNISLHATLAFFWLRPAHLLN